MVAPAGSHTRGNVCEHFGGGGDQRSAKRRIGAVWVARKFRVRQSRAEIGELIRSNRVGRQKIVRAGGPDNVVLIDTVAADTNRTDQLSVAIERKATRENCDAV